MGGGNPILAGAVALPGLALALANPPGSAVAVVGESACDTSPKKDAWSQWGVLKARIVLPLACDSEG